MSVHLHRLIPRIQNRVRLKELERQNNQRLSQISRQIQANVSFEAGQQPVAFFNASTRLQYVSQNAAFSFLSACGVQIAGVPVVHFACQAGMSQCVLATPLGDPLASPPCKACTAQSRWLYSNAPTVWFQKNTDPVMLDALESLDLDTLTNFTYQGIPLGSLVLPSIRWALRRHHLVDDDVTRPLLKKYLYSAYTVAQHFTSFLDQVEPRALVVFNGVMFPEATARWLAEQRGVRVITHEVGLKPLTAFFTDGDATAYPIDIPGEFELSEEQNNRLDVYLEQRFQGRFSMAGVQFWPEMSGLDEAFLAKAARFRQIVPVFTNVIFDTSQIHANTIFPHMFAWLDQVVELIKLHPETLFVIRAHPDETRPGKESRESVQDWVQRNQVEAFDNVVFIPSDEYISSYELIQRAKFVMVYNSSIGLEASIMGAAVLCGGKARFTQIPTVFFPSTPKDYTRQAEDFLAVEMVEVPEAYQRNARRFLYYQIFRTSLPFGDFLEPHPLPGFVRLKPFHLQDLKQENSTTIRVIVEGILGQEPFFLPEEV